MLRGVHPFIVIFGPKWTEGYVVTHKELEACLAILSAPPIDRT
jgi:hypothetical protein